MTPSLSPAQTFSSHTSGSTTLISPSPCSSSSPTYTFHWICPVPSCHTCPTRSRPATLAPEGQFDNYDDMQQLAHELRDVDVQHGVSGAAGVYEYGGESAVGADGAV
ncbi:hypothetical protein SNOG_09779 [Parastagonospora nodorum SN15]|uniref:Uncharacterized protein n=1 Tax=Phaeosphaeria nodorum (strain SN15 / ATCC MYA-4574 / FGSC 10173) TaxID=321614 RepID=Q0UEN5_PHANO|nr:hypothetical protein SNOG_09779 [Parastagonospora nodorum SN15]EAT83044.1 hypothetical protein SNOG_09779 [Parastagonospora nodorum SN15]